MKAVFEYAGALRTATTVNTVNVIASVLKSAPGVGQPFLIFQNLPNAVAMVDWQHESIVDENGNPKYVVSNTISVTAAMINEMLENPPTGAITLYP